MDTLSLASNETPAGVMDSTDAVCLHETVTVDADDRTDPESSETTTQ